MAARGPKHDGREMEDQVRPARDHGLGSLSVPMSAARPSTLPEEPASGSDGVDERQGVDSAFAEPAELDEALGELPADHARGARN